MNERSILEGLHVAIAVVNRDGTIVYGNQAFDSILGEGAGEWLQRSSRGVAGEPGWLERLTSTDTSDEEEVEVEFEGRTFAISSIAPSATDPEISLVFRDVTREREMEQAKSDFTSMIVHDLRGPLSGIQGTLEFILSQDSSGLDPLYLDLLSESQHESERMMGLVDELLDFSKIESGNFTLDKQPVQLDTVLVRSVRSMLPAASRAGVHLFASRSRDLPLVQGDADKLTQVVINLISNSLKFTPKDGVITVAAQVDDPRQNIVVTVADTGLGIRAEDQPALFQKYKQARGKSLRGGGGTGLGLYIVRQLVEAHGGAITVASMFGVGTAMVFTLPVASPRADGV